MSAIHDLINGKGRSGFWWEVIAFEGNDEVTTLKKASTYIEVLTFKVNHKQPHALEIELYYLNGELDYPESLGGDIMEIKQKLIDNACVYQID